jgi:signal recognition particle GTPase
MIEVFFCNHNDPSSYVSSNLTRLVVLSQAVKRGKREGFDIVLCDTSGRTVVVTHWNRTNLLICLLGKLIILLQ